MKSSSISILILALTFHQVVADPYKSVESTLKDINKSAGVCRRDDSNPGATSAQVLTGPLHADAVCGIGASQGRDLVRDHSTLMIDTRSAVDFDRFHVDGAWNLGAEQIRLKRFLAQRTLALMGDGRNERVLYETCNRLKESGYTAVYVVRGGMPAWLSEGFPVVGSATSVDDMLILSPMEFYQEAASNLSHVLLTPTVAQLASNLTNATLLSSENQVDIVTTIKRATQRLSTQRVATIIIAADASFDRRNVLNIVSAVKTQSILFYFGGVEAYKKIVAQQKSIIAAHARGPKAPSCPVL